MDSKMGSKRWPIRSKMGPRWAEMRPSREKMSPENVAIAGRFAVFAKVGVIPRPRREAGISQRST